MNRRVTGLGGIFFKSKDHARTKEWYNTHLGITTDQYGANFSWHKPDGSTGHTVWSLFKEDSNYFGNPDQQYMINYRVENLEELLKALKEEGVQVIGEMETYEYGKFGWIIDPDGRKIELWEPIEDEFGKILESVNVSE